jgi:tripartite-type tricarboxylate transporter receptor subunit TctC
LEDLASTNGANIGAITLSGTVNAATVDLVRNSGGIQGDVTFTHASNQIGTLRGTGAAGAITDTLSGQVQFTFTSMPSVIGHLKAGSLRAVAVTSDKRSRHLPDVPTMIESGLPGFEAVGWFMVMAPARTPAPVLARLQTALAEALAQPAVRERLTGDGAEVVASKPDAARRFLETEIQRWGAVVKSAGLRRE